MGSKGSKDAADTSSNEYPHAAILRGATESDAALHQVVRSCVSSYLSITNQEGVQTPCTN